MGNRVLENRIKRLKEIEAAQRELEQQADAIKAEIKTAMEAQGDGKQAFHYCTKTTPYRSVELWYGAAHSRSHV